jgi:hypothetical protein
MTSSVCMASNYSELNLLGIVRVIIMEIQLIEIITDMSFGATFSLDKKHRPDSMLYTASTMVGFK